MKPQVLVYTIILSGCLLTSCRGIISGHRSALLSVAKASVKLAVMAAPGTDASLELIPGRLFVGRKNNTQIPPRVILRASGLRPGTKIFWSYRYLPGPFNPGSNQGISPFSRFESHRFNHWQDSTIADKNGESLVLFRTTTYAGDRFQFGFSMREYQAGFKDESDLSIRFRNSIVKSKSIEIWKQLVLEQPKILKGVRFPASTWIYVRNNLEKLNIECRGNLSPLELNPADSSIFYYFYTFIKDPLRGRGRDPRYGPEGYGPMEVMLSRLNIIYSDEDSNTVSVFVFGATSRKRDLIRDHQGNENIPIPVNYDYRYRPEELNFMEWSAMGTGSSMAGKSPAIFIWSDFWWLASKSLNTSHDRSLARVILHELGHHLLMFRSEDRDDILDATGHPQSRLITRKSIMTGSGILLLNKRGDSFVSKEAMKLERQFIENPYWHPKIEMLIRRDYLPPAG